MTTRRPTPRRLKPLFAGALLLAGCGDHPTESEVVGVSVAPDAGLAVGIGASVRFIATVRVSGGGASYPDAEWSVDDPAVATIDGAGVAVAVSEGMTTVTASVAGRSSTATFEVYVPEEVDAYLPGTSYFGRNGYIEYIPGRLPVILAAPHGGLLVPAEMPNRSGSAGTDRNTAELTLAVRDAFLAGTGLAPHVVLSHLHRGKLDPNRPVDEAAQDNGYAERAWEEYHGFIDRARVVVEEAYGGGMVFDMHGHEHAENRLELGYLLTSEVLNRTDLSLSQLTVVQMTSIREIGRTRPSDFAEILRGETSLGGLLEAEGVRALPSPSDPRPNDDPYFTGGYTTREHGSMEDTQLVSAIQIEHHFPGLRDTEANRRAYAARLAGAVQAFMLEHFGFFEPEH